MKRGIDRIRERWARPAPSTRAVLIAVFASGLLLVVRPRGPIPWFLDLLRALATLVLAFFAYMLVLYTLGRGLGRARPRTARSAEPRGPSRSPLWDRDLDG